MSLNDLFQSMRDRDLEQVNQILDQEINPNGCSYRMYAWGNHPYYNSDDGITFREEKESILDPQNQGITTLYLSCRSYPESLKIIESLLLAKADISFVHEGMTPNNPIPDFLNNLLKLINDKWADPSLIYLSLVPKTYSNFYCEENKIAISSSDSAEILKMAKEYCSDIQEVLSILQEHENTNSYDQVVNQDIGVGSIALDFI